MFGMCFCWQKNILSSDNQQTENIQSGYFQEDSLGQTLGSKLFQLEKCV